MSRIVNCCPFSLTIQLAPDAKPVYPHPFVVIDMPEHSIHLKEETNGPTVLTPEDRKLEKHIYMTPVPHFGGLVYDDVDETPVPLDTDFGEDAILVVTMPTAQYIVQHNLFPKCTICSLNNGPNGAIRNWGTGTLKGVKNLWYHRVVYPEGEKVQT